MKKILATAILILSAATVLPAAADDNRQRERLKPQLPLQGERIDAHFGNDGYMIGVQVASAGVAGGFVVANRLRDWDGHFSHPSDHRHDWSSPRHNRRGVHLAKHVAPRRGGCDVRHHHHSDGHQHGHGDDHRHSHYRR